MKKVFTIKLNKLQFMHLYCILDEEEHCEYCKAIKEQLKEIEEKEIEKVLNL